VAKSLLSKNPGATILYNLICSRAVPEAIVAAGGRAVRTPVGHALIKPVMKRENAIFGGEHSGHFYFQKNWNADSGLIAMVVAMEVISEAGMPLSELVRSVDPYFRSGETNIRVASIPKTLERVADSIQDRLIDRTDGITVTYEDWWFNLRGSNTEPLLRLNVEANSADLLERKTAELLQTIRGRKRAAAAESGPGTTPRRRKRRPAGDKDSEPVGENAADR
jgi:phosphomannomutase